MKAPPRKTMSPRKGAPARKNAKPAASSTPRRSQVDRSADTRARLLHAAIESLYRSGYAATSTTAVCELANVSRGAMLHQFPTRVDLMLHVVRAVYEEELALYHKALDGMPDLRERALMMPELMWNVLGRPSGVAVLEIMQGSRSDPVLSARLGPLQAEIERDSFRQAGELLGKAGVPPDAARLLVWSIRGLSIAKLLSPDPENAHRAVKLLREMLRVSMDAGVMRGAQG